jgi:hypothetical protein
MPWEVAIKKADDTPIGTRDEIVKTISEAVPAFKWRVEPALLEQIKDMPDHSFHKLLPTWPESTRAYMATPHLKGDLVDGQLSIELYGFEGEPIKEIQVNVRGNGNPIPALAAICLPNGWIVVDIAENEAVDLGAINATGWERFREFRDDAIRRS